MPRLLAPIAAISLAAAQTTAAQAPAVTQIKNVSIIDVERGAVLPARDIIIRDGVIDSIIETHPGATLHGATSVIHATGLFAIPGLFDFHTHITPTPETYGPLLVAHGVAAARDLGAPTDQIIALRASFAAGEALGPDLFVTGAIVDGDPPVWPFSEAVDTPDEARAAVRKLRDAGVDMIKVYGRLNKDVYEAAVSEAHALGLKVTGHIPESVTLAEAMAAGQDCNEHLMRIDVAIAALAGHEEERNRALSRLNSGWEHFNEVSAEQLRGLAHTIARSGMAQCPTIVVMAGIGRADKPDALEDPLMDYVPTHMGQFWASPAYSSWAPHAARIVPLMQKTVAALHEAGVTLMVGTDLANPFVFAGSAVHQEMALWQDAGIPAADILRAATIVPATFCNAADRFGSIAPNKTASLVLLRANPLQDIRNTREIEHVFLRGKHFNRADLDQVLAGVRDSVSAPPPPEPVAEAVDLPGEEIARGRISFKFGDFAGGHEDFVVTRSADGFHLHAKSVPQGAPQPPSTIIAHADLNGRLKKVLWTQHGKPPVEATYTFSPERITAEAIRGGDPQPVQATPLTPSTFLSLTAYSGDFLTLRAMNLAIGETRELTALNFGYPDWRIQPAPYTIKRHEDTTLERNGAEVPCSRYTSELKTPFGVHKIESWHDERYIPLRSVLTMPFGVLTAELE